MGANLFKEVQSSNKLKQKSTSQRKIEKAHFDSGFPTQFIEYISHAKSLRFDQQPNYNYLRKTFRTLAVEMQYTYDYQFDWTKMDSKN